MRAACELRSDDFDDPALAAAWQSLAESFVHLCARYDRICAEHGR